MVTNETNVFTAVDNFPVNPYTGSNAIYSTNNYPCMNPGNTDYGWITNVRGSFWANNYGVVGMTDVWCVDVANPSRGMEGNMP